MRRTAAALLLATITSLVPVAGCGWFAVNNPRRSGLDCSRTLFFPIADALVAIGSTAVLVSQGVAGDEPVSLLLPTALLTSGAWGAIKVRRCQEVWRGATPEQIAQYQLDMLRDQQRRDAEDRAANERLANRALSDAANSVATPSPSPRLDPDQQGAAPPSLSPGATSAPPGGGPSGPASGGPPPLTTTIDPPPGQGPTPTIERTSVPRGIWRTQVREECRAYDWAGTTSKTGPDRTLHVRVMTDACLQCVESGKLFILQSRQGPITGCE